MAHMGPVTPTLWISGLEELMMDSVSASCPGPMSAEQKGHPFSTVFDSSFE